MSYYYVNNSGTDSGTPVAEATLKTGTFPTDSYGTIEAARTDGMTAGDICLISDNADWTKPTGDAANLYFTGESIGSDVIKYILVSNSSCDTPVVESTSFNIANGSALYDLEFYGNVYIEGLWIKSGDDFRIAGSTTLTVKDAVFETTSSGAYMLMLYGDGSFTSLRNVTLKGSSAAGIQLKIDGSLEIVGGSMTGSANMFNGISVGGGCWAKIVDFDASACSGYLIGASGNSRSNDDSMHIYMSGVKMHSSATYVEESFSGHQMYAEFYQCASTSAEAEYQFYIHTYGGYAESLADNDTPTVYRNESTAFPSGRKVTCKIVTNATTFEPDAGLPFRIIFPGSIHAALSTAATDTIRLHIACDVALTDADIWAELIYPGTNKHEWARVSSIQSNILAAGTTLTSDTGSDWQTDSGAYTGNEYKIDLEATSASDCVPEIQVYVAKANTTIYIDTTLSVVSGD